MHNKNLDEARISSVLSIVRANPQLKTLLRGPLERLGFGTADWVREVMYKECFKYLDALPLEKFDALEISAGPQWKNRFNFKSFTETQFPQFDICSDLLPQQYDLIIADQVFEHLPWPYRAVKNVFSMLKPGGIFIIATPFLVRVHNVPIDCSRWTETGLYYFLQEGGFEADDIVTNSWGNRSCVVGNFKHWSKRGFFGSRKNEPNYPVMVWAYARRAIQTPTEANK